jgi:hypothetical protein
VIGCAASQLAPEYAASGHYSRRRRFRIDAVQVPLAGTNDNGVTRPLLGTTGESRLADPNPMWEATDAWKADDLPAF